MPSGSRGATLNYANTGEGSRFVPFGYSSTGPNVMRRVENQPFEQPIVVSSHGYASHTREDASTRTIDPIVLGSDSSYRPQRLIEVREHPTRGMFEGGSL